MVERWACNRDDPDVNAHDDARYECELEKGHISLWDGALILAHSLCSMLSCN